MTVLLETVAKHFYCTPRDKALFPGTCGDKARLLVLLETKRFYWYSPPSVIQEWTLPQTHTLTHTNAGRAHAHTHTHTLTHNFVPLNLKHRQVLLQRLTEGTLALSTPNHLVESVLEGGSPPLTRPVGRGKKTDASARRTGAGFWPRRRGIRRGMFPPSVKVTKQ